MKTHLIYLREGTQPVACVAILEDGANSAYQLSACSHLDVFDKPLARTIALGRLKKKPIPHPLPSTEPSDNEKSQATFYRTTQSVVNTIRGDEKNSKRTRRAALAYLKAQAEAKAKRDAEKGKESAAG